MTERPIDHAKKLVAHGFHVFPLQQNGKKPAIKEFTQRAAKTPEEVERLWMDPVMEQPQPYNIGIATTAYRDGALLVVDVDVRDGKKGMDTLTSLELNGHDFPETLSQKTASGGMHLVYRTSEPVKQGANVLGPGLDVRGRGGYVVGAGSTIDGKTYQLQNGVDIAEAPAWMVEKCNAQKTAPRQRSAAKPRYKLNSKASIKRVKDYLAKAAPSIQGEGGDEHAFKVASRCKDLGVDEANALELMCDIWNPRCQPPWNPQELSTKIQNAYAYGQNEVGVDAPEADFEETGVEADLEGPVAELNKEFAFVVVGGRSTVLKMLEGKETLYMNVSTFHDLLKSRTIFHGGKWHQLSDVWMASPNRATYDRVEMLPLQEAPANVYNLWQGFACEPLGPEEQPTQAMQDGVGAFVEHAKLNVCGGDLPLYRWLMGYFAHMVQRPMKKPSTALVFRGEKGVGKNALIDRIGNLFPAHYLLTSNKRYLTSNFNNHLGRLLLFVLDEAFWSGDKGSEGILKDLITGNQHLIEQKGREMYTARNLTRVCIIGNEDWLVPSSQDERRFAVFNVGNSRQQDTKFFTKMRRNLEKHGGNRLLLRELQQFNLDGINPNRAPQTIGLLEQKLESLNLVHSWWFQSLQDGQLANLEFGDDGVPWPREMSRDRVRDAFTAFARDRHVKSWLPTAGQFGKFLAQACPGLQAKRAGGRRQRQWTYIIPPLPEARQQFDDFIRHPVDWPSVDIADTDIFS